MEDSKRRGFPISAPAIVPIKNTNYAIPASAIFVAPDGKEDASGSQNAPTTLANALKIAPAGGTVVLRGGTYRGGGWTVPRQLTLQAFPNEKPALQGSAIVEGWMRDGNLWRHDGWKSEFPPRGYEATVLDKIIDKNPMAANSDTLFIDGQALYQVATREAVGRGQFFVDYNRDQIFSGDDPTGKTVESTTQEAALTLTKRGAFDSSGARVRGLDFTHYASVGLNVSAPKVLIENCTFAWNQGQDFNLSLGRRHQRLDSRRLRGARQHGGLQRLQRRFGGRCAPLFGRGQHLFVQ